MADQKRVQLVQTRSYVVLSLLLLSLVLPSVGQTSLPTVEQCDVSPAWHATRRQSRNSSLRFLATGACATANHCNRHSGIQAPGVHDGVAVSGKLCATVPVARKHLNADAQQNLQVFCRCLAAVPAAFQVAHGPLYNSALVTSRHWCTRVNC